MFKMSVDSQINVLTPSVLEFLLVGGQGYTDLIGRKGGYPGEKENGFAKF